MSRGKRTGIKELTVSSKITRDLRGILIEWKCPNCNYRYNNKIDTIYPQPKYRRICDNCLEEIIIYDNNTIK